MIGIINYGSGNVGAIANIFKQLKIAHVITESHADVENADRYILPGVGHFDATMAHIRNSGLLAILNEQVMVRKKKILGICVGMQLLAETSEEGTASGLGWIPGHVRRIDATALKEKPSLPHMGWNSVELTQDCSLVQDVNLDRGFYFLHSYYFDATDKTDVVARVAYGQNMTCGVARGNVYGFQFHPEKSQQWHCCVS